MPRNKSQKSIKKSSPYKGSRSPINAWILFSHNFYSLNCETRKLKRTDAMKLAAIAWKNMPNLQKYQWFILCEHQKQLKKIKQTLTHLEELTYDKPFIIEEINQLKVNKEKDDDLCLKAFINPEILEKEMEEDFSLKAFSEKFGNLSIMH